MRTRFPNKRTLARPALLVALVLVVMLAVPAFAGAMTINQSSVQPNGYAGQDTYGGIPTRLTWTVLLKQGDPGVQSLTMQLPQGSDLSKANVVVDELGGPAGLDRIAIKYTTKITGSALSLQFAGSAEPTANLRVRIENVVFPAAGGTFQITGSAETSTGTQPLPAAQAPIQVVKMPISENMIYHLNQQAWVTKWNSVLFLNMFFRPQVIVASFFLEFSGWFVSLALVMIGFPIAIPIGLALAFSKMSKIAPLRWIASFYVNVIRGTPLFLQMYIAFFGLPLLGFAPNKYFLGVAVLALNSSAYLTEIFRAGIQSISKGQFEAASSLGMNYWQSMQYVIIPQTVKRVLPTMTSEFILLYKDTAMLSAVGVFELMLYSKNLAANSGNVTPYVVAAVFYLVITTPLIHYVRALEERLAIAEGGAGADKPAKHKRRWPWVPASAGPVEALEASSVEHESR